MAEKDLGKVVGDQGPQGIQGPKGDQGIQGPKGDTGNTGPGVVTGGTTGQILTKASGTNYDTGWVSPVNNANQTAAGKVLDARMGKTLNDSINAMKGITFRQEGDTASEYIEKGTYFISDEVQGATQGLNIYKASENIPANTEFDPVENVSELGIDIINYLLKYDIPPKLKKLTATDEIAIIINGKQSSVNVTKGSYVLLRNSTITGKADGAYMAAKAITANTGIDGTYLTDVSGGIANGLHLSKASVANANADLDNGIYYTTSASQNVPTSMGCLLNMKASGPAGRRMQFCMDANNLWFRFGSISSDTLTWGSWYKITATTVT